MAKYKGPSTLDVGKIYHIKLVYRGKVIDFLASVELKSTRILEVFSNTTSHESYCRGAELPAKIRPNFFNLWDLVTIVEVSENSNLTETLFK